MDFDPRPIGINLSTKLPAAAPTATPAPAGRAPVPAESATRTQSDAAQLSVDVYETNDTLYIVAPLAGVTESDVRVEITDDVVVIEGERLHPVEGLTTRDVLVQECYFGKFARSIVLPDAVNSREARAVFKKNVLVISMPKLDTLRTRVIQIERSE